MKKLFLNIYFWPVFFLFTLVGICILPAVLLFRVLHSGGKFDAALRWAIRVYGWVLVRVVPFFGPVTVLYERKNIQLPAIFVANHNSAIDPYLFGMLAVENSFVTSWPFNIPVYSFLMRCAGYIDVREGWEKVSSQGRDLFADGCSVIVWPEGRRSRDGKLNRFKKGAFALAAESGVPVIPVSILGSGKVLPPGSFLLNPCRIRMIVHESIHPQNATTSVEIAEDLRRKTRAVIEKTLWEHGHLDK